MNVLPVMQRELRAEARRPVNNWLRFLGAASAMGILALAAGDQKTPAATLGAQMFVRLHLLILGGIWLLAPALTADCLSRERREGTLGLLFLTPLKAIEIVTGKMFVNAWRTFVFWLAVAPVMTLPLLLGGITRLDICTALALEMTALILAVSVGVLASSLSTSWARTMLLSILLSILTALVFGILISLALEVQAGYRDPTLWEESTWTEFFEQVMVLQTGWDHGWDYDSPWSVLFAVVPIAYRIAWRWTLAESPIFACLVAWAILHRVALRTQRAVREDDPSPARTRIERALFLPRFGGALLKRRLAAALDRNPVVWLHLRSTGSRLLKWGWCALIVAALCEAMTQSGGRIPRTTFANLAVILTAGLALSSVASFRRERESGMFDLMLASPLTPRQIIWGRAVVLWEQILPATLALVMFAVLYFHWRPRAAWGVWVTATYLANAGLMIPFAGMYLSIWIRGIVPAWIACLALTVGSSYALQPVAPWTAMLLRFFGITNWENLPQYAYLAAVLLLQWAVGGFAYYRLHRLLASRQISGLPNHPTT